MSANPDGVDMVSAAAAFYPFSQFARLSLQELEQLFVLRPARKVLSRVRSRVCRCSGS